MRTLLLFALVLGLVVVAVPMPAQAHETVCIVGDMNCYEQCVKAHGIKAPLGAGHCRWAPD